MALYDFYDKPENNSDTFADEAVIDKWVNFNFNFLFAPKAREILLV